MLQCDLQKMLEHIDPRSEIVDLVLVWDQYVAGTLSAEDVIKHLLEIVGMVLTWDELRRGGDAKPTKSS